jgi:hypothetical protein
MSVFRSVTVACPACTTEQDFELVLSVNADRRPDLRESILDGSFQRVACATCGVTFRLEPELTYIDLKRGQFLGVWPWARRTDWPAAATQTQETFDLAFGAQATPEAKAIGDKLVARAVFGWPALVEKLLAADAAIDDRSLEIAKVVASSRGSVMPVPGQTELRLVAVDAEGLVLSWVRPSDQSLGASMRVPRQLIADIEAEPEAWRALRDDVGEGIVVDFQREALAA